MVHCRSYHAVYGPLTAAQCTRRARDCRFRCAPMHFHAKSVKQNPNYITQVPTPQLVPRAGLKLLDKSARPSLDRAKSWADACDEELGNPIPWKDEPAHESPTCQSPVVAQDPSLQTSLNEALRQLAGLSDIVGTLSSQCSALEKRCEVLEYWKFSWPLDAYNGVWYPCGGCDSAAVPSPVLPAVGNEVGFLPAPGSKKGREACGDCGVASGSAPVLSKVDVKILLEEAGTILGEVAAESITEIVKNAVSAPKEVSGCVTQATTARTLCLVDLVPLDLVAPCLQKFPEKHGRGPPQGQGRSSDQPTGPQISSPQLSSPSVAPDAPPLQVQELPEVTALGGLCKGGKGIPHDKYWDEIAAALTGDVGSALILALAGLAPCFETRNGIHLAWVTSLSS